MESILKIMEKILNSLESIRKIMEKIIKSLKVFSENHW